MQSNNSFISAIRKIFFLITLLGIATLLTLSLLSLSAIASPGDLDADFNPGVGADRKPVIYGVYPDSNGTYIAYGSFTTVGGASYANIVRLALDGTVDGTFTPPSINGNVRAVAKRTDGKFYVGGDFRVSSTSYYDLALIEATGALDTSFRAAFAGQGIINALAVQPDDKVMCGGVALQLSQVVTDPTRHLVRVQSNGFADGDYPVFNGPRAYVDRLAMDPNTPDSLWVSGAFNPGTTTQINWLTKLTVLGAVESSLPDGAVTDGPVLAVIDASDSKTYVAGNFTKAYGITANRVMRVNSNGTQDATFAIGSGPNGDVTGALRLPDNSLILVGSFTSFNGTACNRIVRLTSGGAVDTSFAIGTGANAPILSITSLPNGSLALTGAFTAINGQSRKGLAAISTAGALLSSFSSFNPGYASQPSFAVNDLEAQPDGRIVIGGNFNWFGGVWSPGLARLEKDGAVDATFDAGLGPDGLVEDVALRADGLIYAVGDFPGVATRPLGGVARYTATGGLDGSFKPIVTLNDNSPAPVHGVLPLSGNKVLVGGHIRKVAGTDRSPLARLSADGSLDAAFNPQIPITNGTGLAVYAMAEDDGDYDVGGYVTYDSLARGFYTRLTATGGIDPAFTPTSPSAGVVIANSIVREIVVEPDGKAVFCGDFTEIIDGSFFDRPQRRGLARYTATGGLDPFDSTTGALSLTYVESLSLEPSGGILFAGGFTTYNDTPRARLARTTPAGALDTSFDPGTGVTARAWVIRRVGVTRGLVGGEFTTYQGVSRQGLAAFVLDPQPLSLIPVYLLLLLNE